MPSRRLHPSARTTRKQRRQIQQSQDTDRDCARREKVNPKTVAKWRRRTSVEDEPMGPKKSRKMLPLSEEVLVVALRQLTWASLEVLLSQLQSILPHLNRSAVYRVWEKWGVSRKPRTAPPPDFPFARRRGAPMPDGEPFQLRVVRLPAAKTEADKGEGAGRQADEEVCIFIIGEKSGELVVGFGPDFDADFATDFVKEALEMLRESGAARAIPMTQLTTPLHWAFCDEKSPHVNTHLFRRFCLNNNIVHKLVSNYPTPICGLEKGWPGFELPRKAKRRKKRLPPEDMDF